MISRSTDTDFYRQFSRMSERLPRPLSSASREILCIATGTTTIQATPDGRGCR